MQTTETTSRKEHLEFCKQRAFEYIEKGDLTQAWGSFMSDMAKHEETRNHPFLDTAVLLISDGHYSTKESLKKFINDFN